MTGSGWTYHSSEFASSVYRAIELYRLSCVSGQAHIINESRSPIRERTPRGLYRLTAQIGKEREKKETKNIARQPQEN